MPRPGRRHKPPVFFFFLNLIKSGRLFTFRRCGFIYHLLMIRTYLCSFVIPIDQLVIIVISEVKETPYSVQQAWEVAQDIIV